MNLALLVHQCAPNAPVNLLQALIRTESGFNPLALHLNGPVRLRHPPTTAAQAGRWADWLIRAGYSVDMGLMQVNSTNLTALNLTPLDLFDPCKNIRAGVTILTASYTIAARAHGSGSDSLLAALSAYNTGNFHDGFRNGYVVRVLSNAAPSPTPVAAGSLDSTCRLTHCSKPFAPQTIAPPERVGSAIAGFAGGDTRGP